MGETMIDAPEEFIERFGDRVRSEAGFPEVLDVACGAGRHALFFARKGCRVIGLDRSVEILGALRGSIEAEQLPIVALEADVEKMSLMANSVDAIVNTFFLHRPLAQQYPVALRPGGLVFFRTFTTDHRHIFGNVRPRADFLLESGELLRLFPDLDVLHYEELAREGRATATIVARRPGPENGLSLAHSGRSGDPRPTA